MELGIWITWSIKFSIRYSRSFWGYLKKHGEKTVNPSKSTYLNKIENRLITFKIKTRYYLKLEITPETLKLIGSNKK